MSIVKVPDFARLGELSTIPRKYHRMYDAWKNDPPKGHVAEALDLFFMTLRTFGKPPWSDDTLGQSLAWAFLAGFPECTVVGKINIAVLLASYRYSLRGGCVPDFFELRQSMIPYALDLYKRGAKAEWLPALMARYEITGWEKLDYREWVKGDTSSIRFIKLRRLIKVFVKQQNAGVKIRVTK